VNFSAVRKVRNLLQKRTRSFGRAAADQSNSALSGQGDDVAMADGEHMKGVVESNASVTGRLGVG
jgi:hypothetical protein